MRYRIKELNGSVIVKVDRKAHEDDTAIVRRTLSAFLRRPKNKMTLWVAGWHKIATPDLEFLKTIHREAAMRGTTVRLCAFGDTLWIQFDPHQPSSQVATLPHHNRAVSRLEYQPLALKRSA
ncbi:MAG: hypothetical protein C3F12_02370 [Candidatus Methylomirabilota bacterium]|nr:hypothetical protein [candidate division NC10 bacterium]PWB48180.1 MAG: hypothetical protein C3F12_02370 [candidate division NC10 bacterium]